jgi:hypothetical protein
LPDTLRAGDFDNPGAGRDQNTAVGEMHTFPEDGAGVVYRPLRGTAGPANASADSFH